MTGPEHYQQAEAMLAYAAKAATEEMTRARLAKAQVHATLALVAATANQVATVDADGWGRTLAEAPLEYEAEQHGRATWKSVLS